MLPHPSQGIGRTCMHRRREAVAAAVAAVALGIAHSGHRRTCIRLQGCVTHTYFTSCADSESALCNQGGA
jgi:hypothetical protein